MEFLDWKGPKRAQNEVFQDLWKTDGQSFSNFLHDIRDHSFSMHGKFCERAKWMIPYYDQLVMCTEKSI